MTHLNRLRSSMGAMAQIAGAHLAPPRLGLVSSYDPNTYAVKVKLQPVPEDGKELETGWLPVWTPWVGNQWGLFCPPQVGDQVLVLFQEGSVENGICIGALFNDEDKPLNVPSKEFWLVHEKGAYLKFTNDGNVSLNTKHDLIVNADGKVTATVGGDADITVKGDINSKAANWTHDGPLHVTKDITCDQTVTATTDVVGGGKSLKSHTHSDPQGGNTGAPN